jgi:hypothetical protein
MQLIAIRSCSKKQKKTLRGPRRALHLSDLFPCRTGRDIIPPSSKILSLGDQASLAGPVHKEICIGQVHKVGQGEIITSKILALPQPLVIHIKHLRKLRFILLNHSQVSGPAHHRCKCELEDNSQARWVKALAFRLYPLFNGSACNTQLVKVNIKGENLFPLFICVCCIYFPLHVNTTFKNRQLIINKNIPEKYASCWILFVCVFNNNSYPKLRIND